MNAKEMIVSVITAMVVVAMFASTAAAAITVDGTASPGEWAPGDKLVDDTDPADGFDPANGFNISSMWAHYESGTMYFRLDVYGKAGDTLGGGDDSSSVDVDETYSIHIDHNLDGSFDNNDYHLQYNDDSVKLRIYKYGIDTGADVSAAHDVIIEFSMPVDGYIDPNNFCIRGFADSDNDDKGEDRTSIECRQNLPPVAVITGTDVCYCTNTEFDGTGSNDPDGTIVSYKWDFENDGTYDHVGTSSTTSYHYPAPGTYTANLTVVDNDGLEDSATTTVEVYGNPTADAKADGSDGPVNLPAGGGTVTFDGTNSTPDSGATIVSYTWTIPGVGTTTYTQATVGPVFIDHSLTATLTVVDNNGCTDTDTVRIEVPTTHIPNVPILTPAGMIALIGLLGIVGGSRILRRGRRS